MALSPLDRINRATSKYIANNSRRIIDSIFQQDPLIALMKTAGMLSEEKPDDFEEKPDDFDEFVKYTRAEYGRNLWDPED